MSVLNQLNSKSTKSDYNLDEVCFIFTKKNAKSTTKQIAEALTAATGIKRSNHSVSYKLRWLSKFETFEEVYSTFGETFTGEGDITSRSQSVESKVATA